MYHEKIAISNVLAVMIKIGEEYSTPIGDELNYWARNPVQAGGSGSQILWNQESNPL